MAKQKIGLIGMEVMGRNLARNIAGYGREPKMEGFEVVAYNRTESKTKVFLEEVKDKPEGRNITGAFSVRELVNKVGPKGMYWIMVKAGKPVDAIIEQLKEYIEPSALLIDGGNSFFKDTIRREDELKKDGLHYIGTGVSGGEEGALKGPAIMPGGSKEAYQRIEPILRTIAAKAPQDNAPCVSYLGPGGAGHYVKMVHNGIEYGDMALIGEAIWILKEALGWSLGRVGEEVEKWNADGDSLQSYLIEITAEGLKQKDSMSGGFLVDYVADITRMKGTGLWTCQSADELLVPIPTIYAAVMSRMMSEQKDLRLKMSKKIAVPKERFEQSTEELVSAVHDALYVAKISSYAQGISLLQRASDVFGFGLNLGQIAKGWRGGCIIRAVFLDEISRAYANSKEPPENLIATPIFTRAVNSGLGKLAEVTALAHRIGVPAPVMDASYNYLVQLRSPVLVSASVQAEQRDYFGAHGYYRISDDGSLISDDEGRIREFHTPWMEPGRKEVEVTKENVKMKDKNAK